MVVVVRGEIGLALQRQEMDDTAQGSLTLSHQLNQFADCFQRSEVGRIAARVQLLNTFALPHRGNFIAVRKQLAD